MQENLGELAVMFAIGASCVSGDVEVVKERPGPHSMMEGSSSIRHRLSGATGT